MFCENLRKVRKERKMTQGDLGKLVGVAKSSVSEWEKGNHMPDVDTISRIASALNVSFAYLVQDEISQYEEEYDNKKSPSPNGEGLRDEFDEIADTLLRLARRSGNTSPLTTQQKNAIEAAVRLVSAATDEELTPQQSATLDAIASLLMTNFDGSK